MRPTIQTLLVLTLILQDCFAPPVSQTKKEDEDSDVNGLEDYMEYHRYLKEVVNALESDPDFRKKLEKAEEHDIKSGKIAEELEFVSHHVRNRLDEIKRVELERLKQLMEKKRRLENGNDIDDDPVHHHLDHSNPHTFEIDDLKKLIAKTTADLAEADKKRKEQFKQYEMEKEYKKQDKLNHTNGTEREKLEKEFKEMEEKHKKHEKLHEPGHKAQLEEVWEEQDQMQQDFDPKTFFMLHDVDGNGLWDQDEVKSLFIKELDKMYQQGAPEDDMRERIEEMERMRESVFNEMDVNRDGFIDFNEFLSQTNTNDFKQDHGWQALDEQKPYTDEELAEFIARQEASRMHHGGGYQVPPGGYQQPMGYPQGYQQHPQAGYHPNEIPQGNQYPGQNVPQQQYQQYQQPQYQHHQQPQYQQQQGINNQQQQVHYQQQQAVNNQQQQVNYQQQQAVNNQQQQVNYHQQHQQASAQQKQPPVKPQQQNLPPNQQLNSNQQVPVNSQQQNSNQQVPVNSQQQNSNQQVPVNSQQQNSNQQVPVNPQQLNPNNVNQQQNAVPEAQQNKAV